jgi:hypothetical protein
MARAFFADAALRSIHRHHPIASDFGMAAGRSSMREEARPRLFVSRLFDP